MKYSRPDDIAAQVVVGQAIGRIDSIESAAAIMEEFKEGFLAAHHKAKQIL